MKFLPLFLATTASLVAAQNVEDFFPKCSIKCLLDAVSDATDCSQTDGVCICIFDNYAAIVDDATNCVMNACGGDVAVNTVLPAAADYCSAVTASATAKTASPTSGATTTSESAPPATATPTGASGSASSSTSASTSGSASATGSSSAPAATTSAVDNGAAGVQRFGLAAVLGLGLAAL